MQSMFNRKTIRNGLILLGIFSLVGLFTSIPVWFFIDQHGDSQSKTKFLLSNFTQWYVWALLTPGIYRISKSIPIRAQHLLQDILSNIAVSLLFVIGKSFLDGLLAFGMGAIPHPNPTLAGEIFFRLTSPISFMVFVIYWMIMAVIYILQYKQKLQEQEVASSQLQAQLAQAQLNALKMQLQPHFLFNTLNSISSLLRENVEAADEMIIHLSDMLRYSLNTLSILEVALREEITFLQHYLDIEKIRFQDRLQTEFDIDSTAMNAMVPSMLLQPLVENSIRHGIAKQSAPGKVSISAKRRDDRLEITVLDTGNSFSSCQEGEGIGLSNTRMRLEKLYGNEASLQMDRTANQETVVRISIPYSEMERKFARVGYEHHPNHNPYSG